VNKSELINKAKGMLVGLAVGDAVGTSVEFKPRGTFPPVTDMKGGGPFRLEKGQWTDDTSMALCMAASLIEKQAFDPADQMNRYSRWYRKGYMSSNGRCFDIGNTVKAALQKYEETGNPYTGLSNSNSAGNGSIMRLAPVVIAYQHDRTQLLECSANSSRTTHGCDEAIECSKLLAAQLQTAMQGGDKPDIIFNHGYTPSSEKVAKISRVYYGDKLYEQLSGSGYVIDTLEAALWCFDNTDNFRDAILKVVNLGDDADTTAAVCGQLAGAYYGYDAIPTSWKKALCMQDKISHMAEKLLELKGLNAA